MRLRTSSAHPWHIPCAYAVTGAALRFGSLAFDALAKSWIVLVACHALPALGRWVGIFVSASGADVRVESSADTVVGADTQNSH